MAAYPPSRRVTLRMSTDTLLTEKAPMTAEQAGETSRRGWRLILGLAKRYRAMLLWLSTASLMGALIEAGFLVLLTGALLSVASGDPDTVSVLGRDINVQWALTAGVVAVLARLALNIAAVRTSALLAARVTSDERHRLSAAYLEANWALQQSQPSGRLQELLTSFVGRVNSSMLALAQGLTAGLSLLAFLSTGLVVNTVATLAILVVLLALGGVLAPIRRRIRGRADIATNSSLQFASRVAEYGSLGLEMQTFGATRSVAERIDDLTRFTTESYRRMQVLNGSLSPVYTFLAYLAILGGIAVITGLGASDLAAIGAIMLLMLRSLSYGQQLMTVIGNLASFLPSLEGVENAANEYRAARADGGTSKPAALMPLTVEDVSYCYTEGRPALTDVSFTIHPAEVIGVIGPSGSGKSTLAQLLLGLRQPSTGRVTVGGVDLRDVERTWWAANTAFVPQDALLFTGTVAENLRFFREGIRDERLSHAARQANILEEIATLPGGFEEHLGERGASLSGGQRQRISLARALAGDPQFLVLDEPTSALDGRSELLIRDTLTRLKGQVTMVIIAHRMSTLHLCDRIMVIQDGGLKAFDNPDSLASSNPFYQAAMSTVALDR